MLMPPSDLILLTGLHNCWSLWDATAKPPEVLLSVNKCKITIHFIAIEGLMCIHYVTIA